MGKKRESRHSLSVVVQAFNEGKNVEGTVQTVIKALSGLIKDYEIVIVNDGSADNTGPISDQLAKKDPRVKVFNSPENKGMGFSYHKGVELASKEYVMRVPGDNEMEEKSIRNLVR